MLFYPRAGPNPIPINVTDDRVLLNDIILPNDHNPHNVMLWVITSLYGPLAAVWAEWRDDWASSMEGALRVAADADVLGGLLRGGQRALERLEGAWEHNDVYYDLSNVHIDAIDLTSGQVELFRWARDWFNGEEETLEALGGSDDEPNGWIYTISRGWQYFPVGMLVRFRRAMDLGNFHVSVGDTGVVSYHEEFELAVLTHGHEVQWFENTEDEVDNDILTIRSGAAGDYDDDEVVSLSEAVRAAQASPGRTHTVNVEDFEEPPPPPRKTRVVEEHKSRHRRAFEEEGEWRAAGGEQRLEFSEPPTSSRHRRAFNEATFEEELPGPPPKLSGRFKDLLRENGGMVSRTELDKAVRQMSLYLGSVDFASLKVQQKFYDKALRGVSSIAQKSGLSQDNVWYQLEEQARKKGVKRPQPGRDF